MLAEWIASLEDTKTTHLHSSCVTVRRLALVTCHLPFSTSTTAGDHTLEPELFTVGEHNLNCFLHVYRPDMPIDEVI